MAGISHGSNHPSFDLDVADSRDRVNIGWLVGALREIKVRLRGGPDDLPFVLDARTIENGVNFTFVTSHGDLDVLGDVAGIDSFDELKASSLQVEISGVPVRIASFGDLIAMKQRLTAPRAS